MTQSAKRILSMLAALLFLAAAFVVFFDLVQPAYSEVETARGRLAGEQASLASEKSMVQQVQNLITAYSNQSQGQENVGLAIPVGEDVAGALTQIEGIAANENVAIANIAIGSPELGAQSAASGGKGSSTVQIVKPISAFTLKLSGTASYEAIQNFLVGLETNIRIFDVEGFSITPSLDTTAAAKGGPQISRDLFNYDISVQTYYQLP